VGNRAVAPVPEVSVGRFAIHADPANWGTLQIDRERHLGTEEVTDRSLGAENVQRYMVPVPRQGLEFQFPIRSADSPDAPDQPPFVAQPSQSRLVAAVGQLETSRTLANPAD